MILPVFRFNLPHLFWFLFSCSVLWKVGRLKPDPANEQIRVIIDGPGEIGRKVSRYIPGEQSSYRRPARGCDRDSGRRWRKVCGCGYAGQEYAGKMADEEGSIV